MTTTQGNRKILDQKRWEILNPWGISTTGDAPIDGSAFVHSNHVRQQTMRLYNATTNNHMYLPEEDAYVAIPSAATTNFGAGTCGAASAWSTGSTVGAASLTATGGTTSTIVTNQTLARDLRGWPVHILSGPNAGSTLTISSNTIGANATITVPTQASAFTNATVYRLGTPRWYVLFANSTAVGSFRVYDFATSTWTALSTTNLPATFGTDGVLVSTPSWIGSDYVSFATGTATSASNTTLVNSGKSWTASQWVNYQIRITGGTGAGQIRTITASDATSVTVATWTVNPDNTSTYSIEGNDDFLYLMGNNAVTLYRYKISDNTWSTLTPGVARGAAPGTGLSGNWICQSTDSAWTNESAIINGRRIYSIRGSSGTNIDYYDIASNAWSSVTYAPVGAALSASNNRNVVIGDKIYLSNVFTWYRFNCVTSELEGFSRFPFTGTAAGVVGNIAMAIPYIDGATTIWYVYAVVPTAVQSIVARMMVF